MNIGITGASGALGRAVAERVMSTTASHKVVLTTRRPEGLADLAARGAEVRRADFAEPETLVSAFAGIDRLLIVSTDAIGSRLEGHLNAVSAAVEAGVGHLVYTSFPEPVKANPALVVPEHEATEEAIRTSGASWTMLRNNLYSHMQLADITHAATSGRLVTNAGSGATAYVTREDCAAAAAAVLTQPGHVDRVYDITGPAAMNAEDRAALARTLGGRDVEVVQVSDDAYVAGLQEAGLPAEVATLLSSFGASARQGFVRQVSTAVQDLTGTAPTPFGDLVLLSDTR